MCRFFSFVTDNRKYYYFDWDQRQQILKRELQSKNGQTVDDADSHSEICSYYGINCDRVNKYEYNPLLKKFEVDQENIKDRHNQAKIWVNNINWSGIVKPLIIKKIKHPLRGKPKQITGEIIKLFEQLISVGDLVGDWVCASVWASVGASVRDWVWASVRDWVCASVGASVWASVWAYISTFFKIKYKYDYSPYWKLWNKGFVASFDGKIWRLHTGKNAKIVKEISV